MENIGEKDLENEEYNGCSVFFIGSVVLNACADGREYVVVIRKLNLDKGIHLFVL